MAIHNYGGRGSYSFFAGCDLGDRGWPVRINGDESYRCGRLLYASER